LEALVSGGGLDGTRRLCGDGEAIDRGARRRSFRDGLPREFKRLRGCPTNRRAGHLKSPTGVVRFSYIHDTVSYLMTRNEVCAIVIDMLAAAEQAIGVSIPPITEATTPVGDLPMFDSVVAEDLIGDIYQRLGLDASIDENPFIVERRARTVGYVTDRLCALLGEAA
jgi:hypothetical protein